MSTPGPFELRSQTLGALPVLNHFLARIHLAERLARCLPAGDARLRLDPAAVIALVVRNIILAHRPACALGEWAAGYDPALLGLDEDQAGALNDDRVGRMLDRLSGADRASLITETVLGVIGEFGIDCSQLHNDSTTVTLTGAYPGADGHTRGGKPTPAARRGHNKDFRPDLTQAAAVHPHDRGGRGGADRLPHRARQHQRRTDPEDLHRHPAPPPDQRRRRRADLRTGPHPATPAGPGPPARTRQRLHRRQRLLIRGRNCQPRSTERQRRGWTAGSSRFRSATSVTVPPLSTPTLGNCIR